MTEENRSFRGFELAGWEDAHVSARYDNDLSVVTTQSVAALLQAVGLKGGMRLLDVATGAGYAAAAAAARGAEVVGVDFSATQIELARRRNPTLRFEIADAAALPFASDTFDAVICGFGLLHFPNAQEAVREAFRVLKPSGRFAFSVWDAPDKTVTFGAILDAMRAHGSLDVGPPAGPNFFEFSNPARCVQVLSDTGFGAPTVTQVQQLWRVGTPEDAFETLLHATVRMRATLRAQTAGAIPKIQAALRDAMEPYRRDQRSASRQSQEQRSRCRRKRTLSTSPCGPGKKSKQCHGSSRQLQ